MAYRISASVFTALPGAIRLGVTGPANTSCVIVRLDSQGSRTQPVRNFVGVGVSGLESVIDCEAPLGRPVRYQLLSPTQQVLATTGYITAPPLPSGRALLRSVLRPTVEWMQCEPQDETQVEWETSTTVHRVVGSDTPVVVGEVRQRHSGRVTFLCRSIAEADQLVGLCRDGTAVLLRHDPCASDQTRDVLFYPLAITEQRWGRQGWRLVSVEYQSTKFVEGKTEEPEFAWTFGDLRDSAPDFNTLMTQHDDFASMALGILKTGPVAY